MRMLRLRSLGQTLIEAGDARLTPTAETVFATTLYLIVEAGRPIGRDELTQLFWPDVSESRAQHGLRQVLYKLKTLGATIEADRSSLILSPRFCTTDFAELLAPQPNSVLEALAENVGGTFLPGYRPNLSEQFSEWVERQRDIVHSAVARALVAGMQAKKRVSDWTGAEQFASMCLSIDPLNEEATLTVAEAAALGGSKSRALSILNNYLRDIGEDASEIKLPAALLRRRISEAYQDNVFPVRDAPFVGREEEMAELTRALARAQSGHGSAYVITGEPGIGKTRLVQEFTRVAALQNVHIVRVGCQSHDVRRPLSVFVDMVPKLLALPGALGCSPESMGYLRRLVAHDPDEARERDELEQSGVSYDSARRSLLDILDAVSTEACMLLQVEDAQWLDSYSRQLFEETSNWVRARRILLLLTSRTCDYAQESIASIELRPLLGTAGTIVARALANERMTAREDFIAWCVSSSGGNPYYLIELVRNGIREGETYQASASLTRLLQNRVRILGSDARAILEVCCILGKHSTTLRVTSCLDLHRTTILRALRELDASGMIEFDGLRLISRHDLLTAVVLEQISEPVKVMLHRYAAEQMELESDSSKSVTLIWESAEHWLAASDAPRAILLLRRCGAYLMDVGIPLEAARVLESAKDLANSPSEKYAIGTDALRALLHADCYDMAITKSGELISMRSSIYPEPSAIDEVGLMAIKAGREVGGSVPALANDCLEALSGPNTSAQEAVSAGGWLLSAADNLCDAQLAHRVYEQVSKQLGSSVVTIDSRIVFEMIYHCSFGDRVRALELADELTDYARRNAPPMPAIGYLRHAAHVHRCLGAPSHALSLAIESYNLATQVNASLAMSSSAGVVCSIHMQLGELEAAKPWISRAEEAYNAGACTVLLSNTSSYLTEFAIRQHDLESAQLLLARTLPSVDKSQTARSRVRGLALQTQISVLRGEIVNDESLDRFSQLYAITRAACQQDFNVEAFVRGLVSAGRFEEAASVAAEYIAMFRRDLCELSVDLQRTIDELRLSNLDGE